MNIQLAALMIVSASLALSGCRRQEPVQQEAAQKAAAASSAIWAARFPADLGTSEIDVSGYPDNVKKTYPYFLAVCSTCHTAARAVNAPYATAEDWKRFVHRMHVRFEDQGYVLAQDLEKDLVDFLAYDSKVRKLDRKEAFAKERAELARAYDAMSKKRERMVLEETLRLPKRQSDYMGTK